jgi:hypothetical protein
MHALSAPLEKAFFSKKYEKERKVIKKIKIKVEKLPLEA